MILHWTCNTVISERHDIIVLFSKSLHVICYLSASATDSSFIFLELNDVPHILFIISHVCLCFTRTGSSFDKETGKVHRRRHHSVEQHLCTPSTMFTTQETLTTHRKRQTGEQLYSCSHCGKSFSSQGGLYVHINIHASKFECTECGKCCENNKALAVHRRSHSGERRHVRVHTGDTVSYTHLTLPTNREV